MFKETFGIPSFQLADAKTIPSEFLGPKFIGNKM